MFLSYSKTSASSSLQTASCGGQWHRYFVMRDNSYVFGRLRGYFFDGVFDKLEGMTYVPNRRPLPSSSRPRKIQITLSLIRPHRRFQGRTHKPFFFSRAQAWVVGSHIFPISLSCTRLECRRLKQSSATSVRFHRSVFSPWLVMF